MKDYYKILGVERTAAADDIKRAYRRLASQHHPDKGGDTNRFQEIEEAYRTLGDPAKKADYDNPGVHINFGPGSGHPNFDFDTIFEVFGTRFGQDPRRHSNHLRMTLWITLKDMAIGGKKMVAITAPSGSHTVEIDLPVGINDGESVRYAKLGPNKQDLVITFRLHPDRQWHRHGRDLYTEKEISIWDLILGREITMTGIRGEILAIQIPARTQPNTQMRLKSRGLPSRDGSQGDVYVKLIARLPDTIPEEIYSAIERNHRNK